MNDIFNNGVRFIEEGGSHEENPVGGVPQGIAPDGQPNLVEEGEVIFNDYVYSKRLKVPKKDYEMLGLKENKEYTYADAAEMLQRESKERPNDPVSKKNMEAMFARLQTSQDELKQKRDAQKMKREFDKMSPEEQAYMLQAMQGSQQAQFAKGGNLFGHRFDTESQMYRAPYYPTYMNQAFNLDGILAPQQSSVYLDALKQRWEREYPILMQKNYTPVKDLKIEKLSTLPTLEQLNYYNEVQDEVKRQDKSVSKIKKSKADTNEDFNNNSSAAQALRSLPVWGSAIGALASMFDTPDYSNIEKAERAMYAVPKVSAQPIGQRLTYRPVDINYIANTLNNNSLGARRAAIEGSLGNSAAASPQLAALNYTSQTALGNALMQAMKENREQEERVATFNRGTDTFNSEMGLKAAVQNQNLDLAKADFLMNTGQLRNAERDAVQANRNASISSFLNNAGNLGQDMLSREQVAALIKDGAYYTLGKGTEDLAKTIYGISSAFGGTLKKKGGKHA